MRVPSSVCLAAVAAGGAFLLGSCSIDPGGTTTVSKRYLPHAPVVVAAAAPGPVVDRRWPDVPNQIIGGGWFRPREDRRYDEVGQASWYGEYFDGRLTANGEIFDRTLITAAHPSMKLPSYVRVSNLENERSIVVRVNDRGPYVDGRLIDVSEQVAELLAFRHDGLTQVRVQYVSPAPADVDDTAALLASYSDPSGAPVEEAGVMLASLAPPLESDPRPLVALPDQLPQPEGALAFVEEPAQPASEVIEKLAEGYATDERIAMAFELVAEIEE